MLGPEARHADISVHFLLDNLSFNFEDVTSNPFSYELNPTLHPLNQEDPSKPYLHKPGSIISVEVTKHDCLFIDLMLDIVSMNSQYYSMAFQKVSAFLYFR